MYQQDSWVSSRDYGECSLRLDDLKLHLNMKRIPKEYKNALVTQLIVKNSKILLTIFLSFSLLFLLLFIYLTYTR